MIFEEWFPRTYGEEDVDLRFLSINGPTNMDLEVFFSQGSYGQYALILWRKFSQGLSFQGSDFVRFFWMTGRPAAKMIFVKNLIF